MTRDSLTARQSQILDLIRGYIADEGCPPTRAEIANILGFRSPNAAEDHLRALQRKGYIEIVAGSSRGIRLVDEDGEEIRHRWDGASRWRLFVEELTGTLLTVAHDAKVQVEFDPDVVTRWRLLGYENRDIADEDFRVHGSGLNEPGQNLVVSVFWGP